MNLAKVIVRLPVELYDQIYRRTLGVKGGMSGYLRGLAERDMAHEAPPIVPEVEREKV